MGATNMEVSLQKQGGHSRNGLPLHQTEQAGDCSTMMEIDESNENKRYESLRNSLLEPLPISISTISQDFSIPVPAYFEERK